MTSEKDIETLNVIATRITSIMEKEGITYIKNDGQKTVIKMEQNAYEEIDVNYGNIRIKTRSKITVEIDNNPFL